VQRWIAAQAQQYAPRTVALHYAVLRGALRTAVRWRLIPTNPAAEMTLPKVPRARRPVLDAGPARAVLRAARGTWHEALFVVALTTGARIGELVPLRWDDWDEGAHLLHIRRRLVDVGAARLEGAPKSEAGVRDQPLPRLAEAALRRHRAAQAARRLELGRWEADGYVFTTRYGRRLRATTITNWFLPRLLAAAARPRLRTHDLRHSFASLLRELGEPVEVVVQLLGHADPGMLMRVYRTLYERETRRAVDRLGDLLEGEC
jgi:integrase